jgi:hypothetical protein
MFLSCLRPGWRAAFSGGEVEGGVLAGDGDDQEAGLDNQTALEGRSSCCHSNVLTEVVTKENKSYCFRIKLFIGLE